jgi:hypothetical protein
VMNQSVFRTRFFAAKVTVEHMRGLIVLVRI